MDIYKINSILEELEKKQALSEGRGSTPRTIDADGNKIYARSDGRQRKIRADVKPVRDANADAVKAFANTFFARGLASETKPYSSARIGAKGEYRRYSYSLGNFAGIKYDSGQSIRTQGFKHLGEQNVAKIKTAFADLKQRFMAAAQQAGLDTSLIQLKLNHGTGFYASVIVKLQGAS